MRKKLLVFACCVILITISVILIVFFVRSQGVANNQNYGDINLRLKQVQFDFNKKNKATYLSNNKLYVGDNIKELKNGYYDVAYEVGDDKLRVYINKLWEDLSHKIDENSEKEYLKFILEQFEYLISNNQSLLAVQEIDGIKTLYDVIKNINNRVIIEENINMNGFDIQAKEEKNELILEVKK